MAFGRDIGIGCLLMMFGYGGYEGGDGFETNKNAVRLNDDSDKI